MSGHHHRLRLAALVALMPLALRGDAGAAGCKDRIPTTWDVEVAPASEPGERLVVTGRVISDPKGEPLAGVTVYVYHADANGLYNLAGHEREPPRLCGILRTHKAGEYRIRTIMPGGYDGPPHIHFEVWSPRVARQMLFVNLERPAAARDTSRMLVTNVPPRVLEGTRTAMTRPVARGADGVLRCVRDLQVGAR